jgi:hypothetical protein
MNNVTREQFYNFIKTKADTAEGISEDTLYHLDFFDQYHRTGSIIHPNLQPNYGGTNSHTVYFIVSTIDKCFLLLYLFINESILIVISYLLVRILFSDYLFLQYALLMISRGHTSDKGADEKTAQRITILYYIILAFGILHYAIPIAHSIYCTISDKFLIHLNK